jgi:hypothetical protein
MNYISGKVVLKETGVGIPNLQVVIHDVDPGTSPEEAIPATTLLGTGAITGTALATTNNSLPDIGDRIGSRLTSVNGWFEFQYEDTEFQIRNPEEKRPDVLLLVLAPEETGVPETKRILYVSPEICQNAGRTEQRLIRISGEALKKAGVALPLDPAVAKEETTAVIGKLNQSMTYHLDIQAETKKIAAARIADARKEHLDTSQAIESRVFESLIGVTAADAKKLNIVMPGEAAAPMMYDAINRTIANTVNINPLAGYLILTEGEAQPFRSGSGYRDHIPAAEIEPILYKVDDNSQRPTFLVRDNPVAAICRTRANADPFGDNTADGDAVGDGFGGSGSSNTGPAADMQLTDLPKFVGRLIDAIIPPEDAALFGIRGRPSADDVQKAVQGLQLKAGPADVPAFYDFHQLQIAFDFVWQHAIDDGVLEATRQLATQLVAAGGDPVGAMNGHKNVFAALKLEAQHVTTAQTTMQTAGVMYRAPTQPPSDGTGNPPLPPPRPPRPPVVKPPFVGGDWVVLGDEPRPADLLSQLDDLLNERYKFEVFAPGTTNFGLLVTYRQEWDPIAYQVGELVKSMTLSPKETRKVSSKRVIKIDRSVKEMQDNQRNRKDETNETMRSEAEIVQKAQEKTSFNTTSKFNFQVGIYSGEGTTNLTRDAEASSQQAKKAFHESVLKAAQEFKDERKLEVETKSSEETEYTDSTEITNPNDELTVTYLFYELQRRFRVSEHIHSLTPVVLVAMEVPNPSRTAIDKILLSHAWIINRVLLDDRYRKALDYLCTTVVGDELSLRDLAQNVSDARSAVETLKKLHKDMEQSLAAREAAFDAAVEARAGETSDEGTEGVLEKGWEGLFGSDKSEDLDALRMREELRKDQYERAVREEKELRMRLDSEIASLTSAQEVYSRANAEHSNHLLQIAGLRVHFKENMLYYMQAIWSFTFSDQIFFTLSSVKVPKLTVTQKTYSLTVPDELPLSISPKPGQIVLEVHADVQLTTGLDPAQDFVTLAEVADLDSLLGYKGNYMMFPLRQSNPLTDYMMLPYLDSELGIHDPDELGSWTPEDFVKYARCLQKELKDELTESQYLALQNQLKEQYRRIVSSPRLNNDEVVVPTTSLYIEALPGAHPLLEDFKLAHRMIDVKKAQAETRKLELENLRYAARLLDNQFEDPDIDRQIQIRGEAPNILVPSEV